MADSPDFKALTASIASLAELKIVPGVGQAMQVGTSVIQRTLYDDIVAEVSAYTASGNPDVLPELDEHLSQHIAEVCRLLAGGRPGDLAFVRVHAHRRAEQKFPLDALLHAYRCVHKVLARWIRDAALENAPESAHVRRVVAAVTDFTIEYTGAIGTLSTSEYVLHTRALAEAEGDRRTALMNHLLSGYDESDSRAAQLLRGSGYLEQRQSFVVAVARSVNPGEMESAARAQRMAESVAHALAKLPIRTLVSVRDNLVIGVLSGTRRQSGWTAPQSLLADRVYPALRAVGPAALIGMSNDAPSTSHIPRALHEAKLALEFASVGERVMQSSRIPFRHMLLRVARDQVKSALPSWLDSFRLADRKARGALQTTLQVYADNDMNVLRTAKTLSLHPNTIYARLQKIEQLTGRNALQYHPLTELLLATERAD
jgi:sugar diacid utilization regulator